MPMGFMSLSPSYFRLFILDFSLSRTTCDILMLTTTLWKGCMF